MKNKKSKNVMLSKHIIPIKYNIHFVPDLDDFTFTGEEEITIEIRKQTKQIVLHAVEIEILSVLLTQNKKTQTGKVIYKEKDERVVLDFASNIGLGRAVVKIEFTGILNDKMRGFYRSRYEHNGKTYHMGVTQFESTDARRAFPGFDEPAQKAVFEVSFKVPSDRTVISNTIESEIPEHEGGYKIVKFAPSPKMSSYLLAFIIGHFEKIEKKTKDGIAVRVFVTPGKKKQAEFALEVAVKCLEFYSDYFKIKYPLPTMDLVAIPDFAAGAMENWGAVTYRETALLVDPEHTALHNKQWVALVIAHELAHQWFGNLVTMEWWTHLWLNEGFASYMEYVAVNSLFPKWNIWTQFVYMDHARALELDGLKNTHPIEVDVNHPGEISEIFDDVSYSKGASVIRMLATYLGEVNFKNGLRAYLKKYSYGNASTNNLWEALEKVSGAPVKKMMQNWTRKPGYPLVVLKTKENTLELLQQRFFSSVLSQKTKDGTTWMVPVSILSGKSKRIRQLLLDKKNKSIKKRSTSWVKLNKDETSFMRVNYSPELLELLKKPIIEQSKKLSEEDRFGIVRDAFAFSQAGYLATNEALALSLAYKNEDSYIVWAEIITDLLRLDNIIFSQPYHEDYKKYCRELLNDIAAKVGWKKKSGESHSQTLLRSLATYSLGMFGDGKIINEAKKYFENSKKNNLEADLRGVVYMLVAENGGAAEYEYFMKRYRKEKFQEEKDRILRALCAFKDKKLLQKTLDFAFSDNVKAQDSFKAIAFIAGNPYGRVLAWEKVKNEWPGIVKRFGGGHLYSRFIKPFASFTHDKDAKEIEKFFKTHESKGLERTIQQVIEQVHSNSAWLLRDGKSIKKFLEKKN